MSAWLYVVLRHRQEKQMLTYGIITYIKPSDITTNTPDSTEPNQIKSGISDMVDNAIIALRDQSPSKAIKDTAQDITAWCMLRWGGPFGARAGTNSMGAKLGIWSDRFENVQCAVMLLAFRRVNAALMLKHQKARIGSDEPGQPPICLAELAPLCLFAFACLLLLAAVLCACKAQYGMSGSHTLHASDSQSQSGSCKSVSCCLHNAPHIMTPCTMACDKLHIIWCCIPAEHHS